MITCLHELIDKSVLEYSDKPALIIKDSSYSYNELANQISLISSCFQSIGANRHDRIGIYLHKTFENIIATFASSKAGAVFVPINPTLKANQVQHIVQDCDVKLLITNKSRFNSLIQTLPHLEKLETIVLTDGDTTDISSIDNISIISWTKLLSLNSEKLINYPTTGNNIASIFYTSGSTGKPKGVVLSHNNMVLGAKSVAQYLENNDKDVILAVLPLSFDYGFSQVTTSFSVGATCVLLDYLLPNDVIKTIDKHNVTGLAAVPPLWSQLSRLNWSESVGKTLRYFTNSGGRLAQKTLEKMRENVPHALPFMMYGLTEAFRSTYLSPTEIDNRPNSIGKAIPNAEILVIRKDGSECNVNEPGELVHKGPLVGLGYWNNKEKTVKRFKAAPQTIDGIVIDEIAVWSGDSVKKDKDGYLYFVARQDDMIKTSGYRVSPTEIEEAIYSNEQVVDAAALGLPHPELGQAILVVLSFKESSHSDSSIQNKLIMQSCQKSLPSYMCPKSIITLTSLPKNTNGKIDRSLLLETYNNYFLEEN